jgi:hypothetical protein
MPQNYSGGGEHGGGVAHDEGCQKLVDILFTIAVKDHVTSLQVPHRKTKGVKLNKNNNCHDECTRMSPRGGVNRRVVKLELEGLTRWNKTKVYLLSTKPIN